MKEKLHSVKLIKVNRQSVITSAKTRLLPEKLRIAQYSRIKKIARQYGINCKICSCKDPDLPWEFCSPWVNERKIYINSNKKQLTLFYKKGFTNIEQEAI